MGTWKPDRQLRHQHQMSQPNTTPGSRPRKTRVILAATLTGIAVLTVGSALFFRSTPQKQFVTLIPPGAPAADASVQKARETLHTFLCATTAADRSACVMDAERLQPVMQAYYAGTDPEPISIADFQPLDWRFESGNKVTVLKAERTRGLPPIIACVKNCSGRWLLDWEMWQQTEDGTFHETTSQRKEGEKILRVRMTRMSPPGSPLVLVLADPFENHTMTLPVNQPDLVSLYDAGLPSGSRHATIRFAWLNDARTGTVEPQIRQHICWGFDKLDDVQQQAPATVPQIVPAPAALAQNPAPATAAPVIQPDAIQALAAAPSAASLKPLSTIQQKQAKPAPIAAAAAQKTPAAK